jgi:hypothetical protein
MINRWKSQIKAHWIVYIGIIAMVLAVMGMTSNLITYWYASQHGRITVWNAPAAIMDAHMNPTDTITAGSGMVIRYDEHRALGCAATYVAIMRGTAVYQFPPLRSQAIVIDHPIDLVTNQFYEVPHDLPPGKYHLSMNVFPTCVGMEVEPYWLDDKVDVNIVENPS